MNIDKYLNNLVDGDECKIYKVADFGKADENEIIYIGDFAIQELQEMKEVGQDFTDEELIKYGFAYTKERIKDVLKDNGYTDYVISRNLLVEVVFNSCTWERVDAYVPTMDFVDEGIFEEVRYAINKTNEIDHVINGLEHNLNKFVGDNKFSKEIGELRKLQEQMMDIMNDIYSHV